MIATAFDTGPALPEYDLLILKSHLNKRTYWRFAYKSDLLQVDDVVRIYVGSGQCDHDATVKEVRQITGVRDWYKLIGGVIDSRHLRDETAKHGVKEGPLPDPNSIQFYSRTERPDKHLIVTVEFDGGYAGELTVWAPVEGQPKSSIVGTKLEVPELVNGVVHWRVCPIKRTGGKAIEGLTWRKARIHLPIPEARVKAETTVCNNAQAKARGLVFCKVKVRDTGVCVNVFVPEALAFPRSCVKTWHSMSESWVEQEVVERQTCQFEGINYRIAVASEKYRWVEELPDAISNDGKTGVDFKLHRVEAEFPKPEDNTPTSETPPRYRASDAEVQDLQLYRCRIDEGQKRRHHLYVWGVWGLLKGTDLYVMDRESVFQEFVPTRTKIVDKANAYTTTSTYRRFTVPATEDFGTIAVDFETDVSKVDMSKIEERVLAHDFATNYEQQIQSHIDLAEAYRNRVAEALARKAAECKRPFFIRYGGRDHDDSLIFGKQAHMLIQDEVVVEKKHLNPQLHAYQQVWIDALRRHANPMSFNLTTKPTTDLQDSLLMTTKIENKTFINGYDATQVKDEQIVEYIAANEAKIKKLQGLDTKSEKIDKTIEELRDNNAALAKILDAR